jgi:hypothetical protein
MAVFWDAAPCSMQKVTDVSDMLTSSTITPVPTYMSTLLYISEDKHRDLYSSENLKSHIL